MPRVKVEVLEADAQILAPPRPRVSGETDRGINLGLRRRSADVPEQLGHLILLKEEAVPQFLPFAFVQTGLLPLDLGPCHEGHLFVGLGEFQTLVGENAFEFAALTSPVPRGAKARHLLLQRHGGKRLPAIQFFRTLVDVPLKMV